MLHSTEQSKAAFVRQPHLAVSNTGQPQIKFYARND